MELNLNKMKNIFQKLGLGKLAISIVFNLIVEILRINGIIFDRNKGIIDAEIKLEDLKKVLPNKIYDKLPNQSYTLGFSDKVVAISISVNGTNDKLIIKGTQKFN
jgi:hypothetical protein